MIKYIQGEKGLVEAAIVPIEVWELIKAHFKEMKEKKSAYDYSPTDFEQMMAGLDIDVDEEFDNIEKEWQSL